MRSEKSMPVTRAPWSWSFFDKYPVPQPASSTVRPWTSPANAQSTGSEFRMRLASPSSPTCIRQSSATRFQRSRVASNSPLLIERSPTERRVRYLRSLIPLQGVARCFALPALPAWVRHHVSRVEMVLLFDNPPCRIHREAIRHPQGGGRRDTCNRDLGFRDDARQRFVDVVIEDPYLDPLQRRCHRLPPLGTERLRPNERLIDANGSQGGT